MSGAPIIPPDAILPLPHWVCVAFAYRCARRTFPLFQQGCTSSAEVEAALGLVQQATIQGTAQALEDAADLINEALPRARAGLPGTGRAEYTPLVEPSRAQQATSYAGRAAAAAIESARTPAPGSSAHAALAYEQAVLAARIVHRGDIVSALAADFYALRNAAARGAWNDHTPVPRDTLPAL
jgi:hypothetical protein